MSSYLSPRPAPSSLDFGRLIQLELQKAEQKLPNHRIQTLDDLKTLVGRLSEISNICQNYIDNVKEQPAKRAFREMEYRLEWSEFLQAVQTEPIPPAPTFLFRAARHTDQYTSHIPLASGQHWSFDNYRECHSVDEFFDSLARHLGNQTNKEDVDKQLTSMSPILEWALHKTGQKWKDCVGEDLVELIIYEFQALRNISSCGVFRVANVLQFLERKNKGHKINPKLQRWARNCDEYITVGTGFHDGFVRSISWQKLYKMPILSDLFSRAHTLGVYRKWRDERWGSLENVEEQEICSRVLDSAKMIAGMGKKEYRRVREILPLILLPGIWFWGIRTDGITYNEVLKECERLLDADMLKDLSQLSIRH